MDSATRIFLMKVAVLSKFPFFASWDTFEKRSVKDIQRIMDFGVLMQDEHTKQSFNNRVEEYYVRPNVKIRRQVI